MFRVSCTLAQPELVTEGEGSSRRAAEQLAAEAALQLLGNPDYRGAAERLAPPFACASRRQAAAACVPSRYNPRMNTNAYRAGHVAVLGRPNVGKSTLVNALVGAKVSIVSPRPQTTRHRLLGIATFPEGQLLLVDTPGIHREQGKSTASAMHRWMNRAARGALEGVDVAVLVVRAGQWDDADSFAYEALRSAGLPVVLVVNQIDRIKDKADAVAVPGQDQRRPRLRRRASDLRAQAQRPRGAGQDGAAVPAGAARAVRRGRDHRQEPALPRRRNGARAADAPARRGVAVRDHGRDRKLLRRWHACCASAR